MTCDDIRLLLGQVSFISKVFMICPIDCKKFALSSCSVLQKTWKDNLVQKRPLLWGINWDNTCRSINHQTKNPNRQRQPIMANWNEKIGYKIVVVNTRGCPSIQIRSKQTVSVEPYLHSIQFTTSRWKNHKNWQESHASWPTNLKKVINRETAPAKEWGHKENPLPNHHSQYNSLADTLHHCFVRYPPLGVCLNPRCSWCLIAFEELIWSSA